MSNKSSAMYNMFLSSMSAKPRRQVKTEWSDGNNNDPPILKLAPPDEYDEKEAIYNLLNAGYSVEVVDPYAELFNQKYRVFQNVPVMGKQMIMVDERGEILGD